LPGADRILVLGAWYGIQDLSIKYCKRF
jgi:hypothetical protein